MSSIILRLFILKNALFDILSLANQFYQSKSISCNGPKPRTIYFLKNLITNIIK